MAKLKICALAEPLVLASSVAFAADVPMEPVPVAPRLSPSAAGICAAISASPTSESTSLDNVAV